MMIRVRSLLWPLALILGVGSFSCFSAFLSDWSFGLPKFLTVLFLSGLFTYFVLYGRVPGSLKITGTGSPLLLPLILFSLICTLDLVFIFGKQGWGHAGALAYFRPPLQDDLQRHLVLVNALLRGSGSPFLAHTNLHYPLFWHHGVATAVGPFGNSLSYQGILGFVLGTATLLFFTLGWVAASVRPSWLLRLCPFLILIGLFSFHSDLLSLGISRLVQDRWAIEADGSYQLPHLFRNFSLKLVALSAPQHAFFFIFACASWLLVRRKKKQSSLSLAEAVCCVFAFLASPHFSILFFVPLFAWEFFKNIRKQTVSRCLLHFLYLGMGMLCYQGAFRSAPFSLVSIPVDSPVFVGNLLKVWWVLPLLLVGIAGMQGMVLSFIVGLEGMKALRPLSKLYSFGLMVGLNIISNNIYTSPEIRRHVAIFSSLLLAFVFIDMKHFSKRYTQLGWRLSLASMLLVGLAGHGYFLYCYLGKPSTIAPLAGWNDYFEMNQLIKRKYPGENILAAVEPGGAGLHFPIVMEVATSFSSPLDALVHSHIEEPKRRLLEKVAESGFVHPYAEQLGYRLVLWGPMEERIWGEKIKKRFLRADYLLEQCGKLSLYALHDNLRERFKDEKEFSSAEFYTKAAEIYAAEGWQYEALGYFQRAAFLRGPKEKNSAVAEIDQR